jgi:formylglycine-generating enzyme required for sulfatase activity
MDGQKQAPADSAITGIPLGSRSFEITRPGFRKPPPITLDFKGIRPIPLPQVAWQPFGGKVALSSTPAGAAVWIGGMDTGRVTPVTFDDVEVGKVEYTLKFPRHADTVVAGEVASLTTLRLSAAMVETTSFPSAGKKAGERRIFNIGPDLRVPFRWCPAGAFTMGGTDRAATAAEKPVRKVTLTQGFWLGETEFTQNQWAAIEGRQSLLLQLSNRPRGTRPPPAGQEMPIHSVSWDQICGDKKRSGGTLGKINAFLRRQGAGAWIADLPTEAQWEYACRAGTTGPFGTSEAGARAMDASSWHHGNSGGVLQPVGLKKANPWGFHDMHGNVREWTRDWYQGSYAKLPATNPTGPRSGWKIAVRGGSFLTAPAACRSSARAQAYASVNHHSLGFRLALRQMETAPKPK